MDIARYLHCIEWTGSVTAPMIRAQTQYDQTRRCLHLTRRRRRWSLSRVPSVALSRNPANAAVALAVALGSGTAEMSETQSLITPGPRVSRPAQVGGVETSLHRVAWYLSRR